MQSQQQDEHRKSTEPTTRAMPNTREICRARSGSSYLCVKQNEREQMNQPGSICCAREGNNAFGLAWVFQQKRHVFHLFFRFCSQLSQFRPLVKSISSARDPINTRPVLPEYLTAEPVQRPTLKPMLWHRCANKTRNHFPFCCFWRTSRGKLSVSAAKAMGIFPAERHLVSRFVMTGCLVILAGTFGALK